MYQQTFPFPPAHTQQIRYWYLTCLKCKAVNPNVWVAAWIYIMWYYPQGHTSKWREVSHRCWLPKSQYAPNLNPTMVLFSNMFPLIGNHHSYSRKNHNQSCSTQSSNTDNEWNDCLMWKGSLVMTKPPEIITWVPVLCFSIFPGHRKPTFCLAASAS